MKKVSVIAVCFCAMLLLMSCDKEPQTVAYSIAKNDQPLSDSDVGSCFDVLGLCFERFTCMVPERTGITISSKAYEAGEENGESSTGTIYVDKGLHEFMSFIKTDQGEVGFSFDSGNGSVSCSTAFVKDYSGSTHGWIPITKLSYDEQPVYVYAPNNSGIIEGFKTDTGDVEAEIAKYDYAIVIYASIASSK